MKLIVVVVQDKDSLRLLEALVEKGLRATKLASTGGFLREGNTTLLIGVDAGRVERVKAIIADTCRERTTLSSAATPVHALEGVFAGQPLEVPVGGAIVFVLSVDAFLRL